MSIYLDRYAFSPLEIDFEPHQNTGLIIVIPVYNEQNTITALTSLLKSTLPTVDVEVLIIINEAEDCSLSIKQVNTLTYTEIKSWILKNDKKGIRFCVQHIVLQKKHAGVGLARKAGMDEAVRRFEKINNNKGVILCFDADCTCQDNYINQVYQRFDNEKITGASIYFEHQFEGLSANEIDGITQYELHLRYYVNALRTSGYPYAFHTVGSSMAVRCDVYKKAGGMNRRKAGEDFHFLHKVIPYGDFEEITTTTVYPSARISSRVPFGTGKAMGDWVENKSVSLNTYNPLIFKDIAPLLKMVPRFYQEIKNNDLIQSLPKPIINYLREEDFIKIIIDIKKQSSTLETFIHRWYGWMNGLKMLHLVHYLRENYYPSVIVKRAVSSLINSNQKNNSELLKSYRKLDKQFIASQINLKHLYSEFL